jgi:hypothetical protein
MPKIEQVYYILYRDPIDGVRPVWRFDTRAQLMKFFGRNETSTILLHTLCSGLYEIYAQLKSQQPLVYVDARKIDIAKELVSNNLDWNIEPVAQDIIQCIHVDKSTGVQCETIAPHTAEHFRVQKGKVEKVCRKCMRNNVAKSNKRMQDQVTSSSDVRCSGFDSTIIHYISANGGVHGVSYDPKLCKECYNRKQRAKYTARKQKKAQ